MVASQLAVNTLIAVSVIFPLALGFALVNRVHGFIHFAHGLVYVAGAYGAYLSFKAINSSIVVCCVGALISASCVGIGIECFCYRPLRHRCASPLVLFLASLGLYVLGQNVIALVIGETAKSIREYHVSQGIEVFGAIITEGQVITVVSAFVIGGFFWLILERSALGIRLTACAQSRSLALTCGMNVHTYLMISIVIASILAGFAAFSTVLDSDITPTMGLSPLMYAIVAAMIFGTSHVGSIALSSLLLAIVQITASWFFGAQWQEAVGFGVLITFLLIRGDILRKQIAINMSIRNHI